MKKKNLHYIIEGQSGLSAKEVQKKASEKSISHRLRSLFSLVSRVATSMPYTELTVADGRFDASRGTINLIILHTMVGTWQSAANLFAASPAPGKETSAHYGIKYDGGLIHWLEEYYTAYHAGNYAVNQTSIGLEHEDMGNYNSPRPDALYATSAKLVADICKYYNIPCDRGHIRKHSEVSQLGTACPDSLDVDRIVREAQAILQPKLTDQQKLQQITALVQGTGSVLKWKVRTILQS